MREKIVCGTALFGSIYFPCSADDVFNLMDMHPAVGKMAIKAHSDWLLISFLYGLCAAEAAGDAVGAGIRRETDGDSRETRLGRPHCNAV